MALVFRTIIAIINIPLKKKKKKKAKNTKTLQLPKGIFHSGSRKKKRQAKHDAESE